MIQSALGYNQNVQFNKPETNIYAYCVVSKCLIFFFFISVIPDWQLPYDEILQAYRDLLYLYLISKFTTNLGEGITIPFDTLQE
jgi:hypothetical protein